MKKERSFADWLIELANCCFGMSTDAFLKSVKKFLHKEVRIIAGLPRARSGRGTEPHTRRLMVNLFSVGCHVIERAYVRTYASTDCMGGVRETIKRKAGVSQACLAKSTSFTLVIHNMVNLQLSKQDSH